MLTLLLFIACGAQSDESNNGRQWTGGNFQFQSVTVNDACLGGALEALFMPEGPANPHDFEYPVYLPGFNELPVDYNVDLREPFVNMPVTVDSQDDKILKLRGSEMEAVELGSAAYGDCVVTMKVDLNLVPTSANEAHGMGILTLIDPRGDDGLCPVFDAPSCSVDLTLSAVRN